MQNEAAKKRKAPAANIPTKKPPKKMVRADDGTRPTSTNSADTSTSPPTHVRRMPRRAVQQNATLGSLTQLAEVHRTRSYTSMVANKKMPPCPLPTVIALQTDSSPAYDEEQDLGAAIRSLEDTMPMSTSDVKPNSKSPGHTAVASRVPSPEPPALSFGRLEYDQEEQDLEEAIFQSMLDVSQEGVSLTVEASVVGSSEEESRPQEAKNHFRTDTSSAPDGEEDPGVPSESVETAGSESIDEDKDMYMPFVGMESQKDGCNSTSTTSEDLICGASLGAKVNHAQEQATNAGMSESSKLLRASMEALAHSLKGPIPTSHTPTALSHVTTCLLPAPNFTHLDPPVFIPGLLTQRLFTQSFLPPRLPAAAVVVPSNLKGGSQNPEVLKASDDPLVSLPPQKEDHEMEVVQECLVQDASESTMEVRNASSENRFGPVEETEDVFVQFLTTEVLKKDPVLEQALITSRLIVDIIRQHQLPKPQAQIPMHDHDNAEPSSPDPQMAGPEHDAAEPSPPPQSRTRTPAPDDVGLLPLAETHPEQHELSKVASPSSVSSLVTSDELPPPSTPTTSDPYDISHLYIRSMSPDDDGDINPDVYSKILDIPTPPLHEIDDDDDVLLSYCFDYPDLDVAA